MAVKRSLKKAKAAPIKRSIKRAPSAAVTVLDADLMDEVPAMVDPTAAEVDFTEAPLTPEQQAEKDTLEGANAAAVANNTTLPVQESVQMTAQKFKDTVAFKEFMALPLNERRKLIDEDQEAQKAKAPKK